MKNILILNDFVSKGKIAGNMMDSVLSYLDFDTYLVPTALISNNFSYGKVAMLDTTAYMRDTFKIYDELGFKFDVIFIGFIAEKEQADLISSYIDKLDYKPLIVLDPIMADNGSLYNGVGEDKIEHYKMLIDKVDVVIPNHTEAKFLGVMDDLDQLSQKDTKFLITSIEDGDKTYNLAVDGKLTEIPYDKIDVYLTSTGDLFDSLFIYSYLKDKDFYKAGAFAAERIIKVMQAQLEAYPAQNDIFIEQHFSHLA